MSSGGRIARLSWRQLTRVVCTARGMSFQDVFQSFRERIPPFRSRAAISLRLSGSTGCKPVEFSLQVRSQRGTSMALKAAGLFTRLKNKLGLGTTESSKPTPTPTSTISSAIAEPSPQIQQPISQSSTDSAKPEIGQTENMSASASPRGIRAKRSSRGSKPEVPLRQRWRRSAVRAARKARSLD